MGKVIAHIFFDVLSLAHDVVTTIWHKKGHFGSLQPHIGIGTAVAHKRAFAERPVDLRRTIKHQILKQQIKHIQL